MTYTIDRFEGEFVICECEDETFVNLKRGEVPVSAKEGDILFKGENGIEIDKEKTEKRKEEMKKLLDNLWQ